MKVEKINTEQEAWAFISALGSMCDLALKVNVNKNGQPEIMPRYENTNLWNKDFSQKMSFAGDTLVQAVNAMVTIMKNEHLRLEISRERFEISAKLKIRKGKLKKEILMMRK